MAEEKNGASEILSKGVNIANTIRSAVKTGKVIASIAKGAAAGGPYGAIAMGLWQNRKLVIKIILAASFIMILPILFILMLPSLIFGGLDIDSTGLPIMNNNYAIYENVVKIDDAISEVIDNAHTYILTEIDEEIKKQPSDTDNEINDDFDSKALFDCAVVISQYQVYKDDHYEDISINDLVSILNCNKSELFSYTVTNTEKTITVTKEIEKIVIEYIESIVTDKDGNQRVEEIPVQKTVIETIEESKTKTVYNYSVIFAGENYFADSVFGLTLEKKSYAEDLANNLAVFMNDKDNEDITSNDTHKSISEIVKDDTETYTGGDFVDPVKNWKNYVTSEFGYRTDPFNGSKTYHNGLDIGMPKGTSIFAAADGKVIVAKRLNTGYGYHIVINHGGKLTTLYAHCSKLYVSENTIVKKGDKIAEVGTTGRSTGNHIHFEVHLSGEPVNPRDYLK